MADPTSVDIPSVSPPGNLDDAGKEQENFEEGIDYAKLSEKSQHERREGIRKHVYYGAIVLVYLGFAILATMLVTWAIHALTPFCWLSPERYQELKSMLFSAAVAGFVSEYSRKML